MALLSSSEIELVYDETSSKTDPEENNPNIKIRKSQIPLLAQQMRQHIQMLTQNFLLTYQHPELYEMAKTFKEYLTEFKMSSEGKVASIYNVENLNSALKLIEDWEDIFAENGNEAIETKAHVIKVLGESIVAKATRAEYVPTFPPLLMDLIANSEVFLYNFLLPRIPFKSNKVFGIQYSFTHHENCLIAMYMEEFKEYSESCNMKFMLTKFCSYITRKLMSHITIDTIERYIRRMHNPHAKDNPIKYFFQHKKAPSTVNYIWPIDICKNLPPSKRDPESLPILWKKHLQKNEPPIIVQKEKPKKVPIKTVNKTNKQMIVIPPLMLYSCNAFDFNNYLENEINVVTPLNEHNNIITLPVSANTEIYFENEHLQANPNVIVSNECDNSLYFEMSDLLNFKSSTNNFDQNNDKNTVINTINSSSKDNSKDHQLQDFSNNIIKSSGDSQNILGNKQSCLNNEIEICVPTSAGESAIILNTNNKGTEKDHLDDFNELMIANSVEENIVKKEPSEFVANFPADDEYLSNSTHSPQNESEDIVYKSWSREEDRIILKTIKKHKYSEKTFQKISQLLSNRNISDIKRRLTELMTLLQEMESDSNA